MTKTELIKQIQNISNLNYISALLEWDQETQMPTSGSERRSEQMALLAGIQSDYATNPLFQESLINIDLNSCTDDEKVIFTDAIQEAKKSKLLSKSLKEEIAKHQSLGQHAWATAREKNDFESFKPYLEKLLNLKKEYAKSLKSLYPDKNDYEILLDEYEPGLRVSIIDDLFSQLKPQLIDLIKRIELKQDKGIRFPNSFPLDLQEEFAMSVIEDIGFDFDRARVDLSAHPFCTNFSSNDVRITTNYDESDFTKSFFSLLHETGHALYELGMNDDFHGTALAMPISLGIHESQSRFWENNIGRSRGFWTHYLPQLKSLFKKEFKNIKFEDFLKKINSVAANSIRIDADEVTYNFHIFIRYEIERDLFADKITVNDIPLVWKQKYKEYLNLDINSDSEGCLQDVHWSLGLFGYFPTYTLGNIYAAQIYQYLKQEKPHLKTDISKGNFTELRSWLNEQIHKQGKRYSANDLIKKITGNELDSNYFIQYLEEKFKDMYQI
jgi:carboxypeptidase Taq